MARRHRRTGGRRRCHDWPRVRSGDFFAVGGVPCFRSGHGRIPEALIRFRRARRQESFLLLATDEEEKAATTSDEEQEEKGSSLLRSIKKDLTYPIEIPDDDADDDAVSPEQDKPSLLRRVGRALAWPFRKVASLYRRLRRKRDEGEEELPSLSNGVEEQSPPPTNEAVELETTEVEATTTTIAAAPVSPPTPIRGDRRAVASVDLSGEWDLIVTEDFKKEYDAYLSQLDQPQLVRSIALSIVGLTTEITNQTDDGRSLFIRGRNVRGVWERTLVASGADPDRGSGDEYEPVLDKITSADGEEVTSESWWEEDGTVHRSWLRGVTKYGGGAFESHRYLEGDDVLVCESTFHPDDPAREQAKVTWRFKRQQQKQ